MSDDLHALRSRVQTRAFGRAHEHHDVLGSTNDRAAAWIGEGAPHGAVVTADAQTEGRGRRGRVWASPPGENLYASVVLRPDAVRRDFGAIGLAVAVGIAEGLPIDVELIPRPSQAFEAGGGYGTDNGPRGRGSARLRRLNRKGHHAELEVVGSQGPALLLHAPQPGLNHRHPRRQDEPEHYGDPGHLRPLRGAVPSDRPLHPGAGGGRR